MKKGILLLLLVGGLPAWALEIPPGLIEAVKTAPLPPGITPPTNPRG